MMPMIAPPLATPLAAPLAAPLATPRPALRPAPQPAPRPLGLRPPRDPRWYQIAVLAGLLGWGLSLCLLLRTDHLALAALAAAIAIASKFALRVDGKHVFNPTNFGITVLLALGSPVWVSPGQWGSVAFFAFLMACLGGLVVTRAARGDVTLAFLGAYAAILFARAAWLGQRVAIPLHQLESGALLLFAFFMISDPKTTPRARRGRVLFAALVACGAAAIQFLMYRTNGLLWSLVAFSPLVPLIDRLLPGPRYEWSRPVATQPQPHPGEFDETLPLPWRAVPDHGALARTRA